MEQVIEPLERAMELTPILGELGYNEKHSFNGLLQVTADGGPSIGESQKVRGLWYGVAIWVKDGPGMGKLIADWMTDGRTEIDHHSIDYARFYPIQKSREVHLRPLLPRRRSRSTIRPSIRASPTPRAGTCARPSIEREKELGGYFMELGGWERAHGYAANEHAAGEVRRPRAGARTSGTTATSGASPTPSIWSSERERRHGQPVALRIYDVSGPTGR
jgi:hypothetical protein